MEACKKAHVMSWMQIGFRRPVLALPLWEVQQHRGGMGTEDSVDILDNPVTPGGVPDPDPSPAQSELEAALGEQLREALAERAHVQAEAEAPPTHYL